MTEQLTTYTFLVKQAGWADDEPHYRKTVRKLSCDAQAEHHARKISGPDNSWVTIKRGDVSWGLRNHGSY